MKGVPSMRRLTFLAPLPALGIGPLLFGPLFAGLLFIALFSATASAADKRVALVVGNSGYRNVTPLDNPANDAKLLADTLGALGFTLVGGGAQLDLDKAAFDRTVQAFGAQLAGADVGLFYYAGHGVQVRDKNYLIPIDANPTKESDVDFQMLDSNLVLQQMEGAGLCQRIGKRPWLGELDHIILGHGVSLIQWRSGGFEQPPRYAALPLQAVTNFRA